jgi:hypothetical protein
MSGLLTDRSGTGICAAETDGPKSLKSARNREQRRKLGKTTRKAHEKWATFLIDTDTGFAETGWWRMQSDANRSLGVFRWQQGKIQGILRF